MAIRDDDDLMNDYCPKCGQYTGGDSVCPNCGATLFDESGLEEVDDDEGGGNDRENSDDNE